MIIHKFLSESVSYCQTGPDPFNFAKRILITIFVSNTFGSLSICQMYPYPYALVKADQDPFVNDDSDPYYFVRRV